MRRKSILISIFIIVHIANIIITLDFWNSVGSSGEFAGRLIIFFSKVKVSFRIFLYSGLSCSILFLIDQLCFKYQLKFRYNFSILLSLSLLFIYISNFTYNYKPQPISLTKRLSTLKITYLKQLKQSEIFTPTKVVLENDKVIILDTFKSFLSQKVNSNRISDSLYFNKFDFLFDKYIDNLEAQEIYHFQKIIKDSLTIDFINYSPDLKFLFTILSYNNIDSTDSTNSNYKLFKSNAFAIIGEKKDNKLFLYRVDYGTNQQGLENKEFAVYSKLIRMYPMVLKKDFWRSEEFEKIKINEKSFYKFQLNWNTLYTDKGEIIKYQSNPYWIGTY